MLMMGHHLSLDSTAVHTLYRLSLSLGSSDQFPCLVIITVLFMWSRVGWIDIAGRYGELHDSMITLQWPFLLGVSGARKKEKEKEKKERALLCIYECT